MKQSDTVQRTQNYALRLYHRFNGWFTQYLPKHKFIVEIESPTAVYLGIMKHNGIPVDTTLMLKRKEEAEQKLQEIGKHIHDIIGDVEWRCQLQYAGLQELSVQGSRTALPKVHSHFKGSSGRYDNDPAQGMV